MLICKRYDRCWNIPDATEDIANWVATGYTTALMVNAGQTVIDATMAAFPNQNVALSIGSGLSGLDLDPTSNYLAATSVGLRDDDLRAIY